MKILVFTYMFPEKGNERNGVFIYRLISSLRKQGAEVDVVKENSVIKRNFVISKKKDYNLNEIGFKESLLVRVINYLKLPLLNISVGLVDKINKIFITGKYDLIHGNFVSDCYPLYLLKKKYNIPYIVTAHGSDINIAAFASRRGKEIVLKVLNNAQKVIFVSNALLEKAKSLGYGGENGIVIHNGFDDGVFKFVNIPFNRGKVIGFVGNLIPVKGADRLAKIYGLIDKEVSNVKFVIIGDGFLKNSIKDKLIRLGILNKTKLTGNIAPDVVAKYMNEMDILVIPSRNEGFSCVIVEARACGVGCVATNVGGIPEAIQDAGILINEGENFEKRFAEAVIKMLQGHIDKKKIASDVQKFSWKSSAYKTVKVYNSLNYIK